MKISDGQTLLFIGDSITDCDRGRPVGERDSLGSGYVSFVHALLEARYPERSIRILNTGIGGNRIFNLEDRWNEDVLKLEPDWLSIFIGINDVWWQSENPTEPRQVDIEEYESTYRRLIDGTQERLKGLILITPYHLDMQRSHPVRAMMDDYGQVVRRLAGEYGALLVDTQQALDEHLRHEPPTIHTGDLVHLNATGHMILARCVLDALGFEW